MKKILRALAAFVTIASIPSVAVGLVCTIAYGSFNYPYTNPVLGIFNFGFILMGALVGARSFSWE